MSLEAAKPIQTVQWREDHCAGAKCLPAEEFIRQREALKFPKDTTKQIFARLISKPLRIR